MDHDGRGSTDKYRDQYGSENERNEQRKVHERKVIPGVRDLPVIHTVFRSADVAKLFQIQKRFLQIAGSERAAYRSIPFLCVFGSVRSSENGAEHRIFEIVKNGVSFVVLRSAESAKKTVRFRRQQNHIL